MDGMDRGWGFSFVDPVLLRSINTFPFRIWGGFGRGDGVGVALLSWLVDGGSGYAGKLVLDPMLIFQVYLLNFVRLIHQLGFCAGCFPFFARLSMRPLVTTDGGEVKKKILFFLFFWLGLHFVELVWFGFGFWLFNLSSPLWIHFSGFCGGGKERTERWVT
ncbi:hypothetical protein HOY80DRAFT_787634 [Tuber brumale]|nr:hypothetical protein HOY80DRAFT_787634 [Tuber brumale]